jgi:hypothetical protein
MIQANRIRQFVRDHYIAPARAVGRGEITIRAGDVQREMSLTNAMPAVCSAIGSSPLVRGSGLWNQRHERQFLGVLKKMIEQTV